jgi:hypothetical protein
MLPRPRREALRAWDTLCDDFAGHGGADADWIDPLDPEEWMRSLSLSTRVPNPTSLLYFTKGGPAHMIGTEWAAALPKRTAILIRSGVATTTYATIVRREALRARCRVRFMGDLDPEDLAIYLSLEYGGYRMRPSPRSAVPIVYAGINDAWIDAAEAALSSSRRRRSWPFPECVAIEMNGDEQRFLRTLEEVVPPLERWVGPRCARLLHAGMKIELEGVLNPNIYPASYLPAIAGLLTGRRHSPGVSKKQARRRSAQPT